MFDHISNVESRNLLNQIKASSQFCEMSDIHGDMLTIKVGKNTTQIKTDQQIKFRLLGKDVPAVDLYVIFRRGRFEGFILAEYEDGQTEKVHAVSYSIRPDRFLGTNHSPHVHLTYPSFLQAMVTELLQLREEHIERASTEQGEKRYFLPKKYLDRVDQIYVFCDSVKTFCGLGGEIPTFISPTHIEFPLSEQSPNPFTRRFHQTKNQQIVIEIVLDSKFLPTKTGLKNPGTFTSHFEPSRLADGHTALPFAVAVSDVVTSLLRRTHWLKELPEFIERGYTHSHNEAAVDWTKQAINAAYIEHIEYLNKSLTSYELKLDKAGGDSNNK